MAQPDAPPACPGCGARVIPGSRFCTSCRRRLVAAAVAEERPKRPAALAALAVVDLAGALLLMLLLVGLLLVLPDEETRDAWSSFLAVGVLTLFALPLLLAGIGMWRMRRFAWVAQTLVAALHLPFFPSGTLAGGLVLGWLVQPGARRLFAEGSARELSPREADAARAAAAETRLLTAGTTLAGLHVVALAALLGFSDASSALPSRGGTGEEAALAEVRTVLEAETAYAEVNGGLHDGLECLARPHECLGGVAEPGEGFLSPALAESGARRGYRFVLHPGPPPLPDRLLVSESRSGFQGFAYVAVPETTRGDQAPWYCGDHTGRVCAGRGPVPAVVDEGLCPVSCEPVE